MKKVLGFLLLLFVLATPESLRAQGVNLEPCYIYEIEQTITIKGQTKSRRESCFTDAELPWASLGLEPPYYLLETGFKLTKERAKIDLGGKKKDGTKLTWKREQGANVHAAAVHFWVLEDLDTPMFKVRLAQNYLDFLVPAGCVKMEVIPSKENVDSVAATGEYGKAVKYKLGDKELQAHEFVCKVADGIYKGTLTYTLSKEIAEGICSIAFDCEFKGGMRVAAMKPAPAPKGLELFPREGFAYAPPAGYMKTPKPNPGEVVRYVNAKGDFISVAILQFGQGGLEAVRKKMAEQNAKDGLRYGGDSRDRHLAGHRSFNAQDRKTKVPHVVTQHAGRGYVIGASALDNLQPDEVPELFRGWRWIVLDKK